VVLRWCVVASKACDSVHGGGCVKLALLLWFVNFERKGTERWRRSERRSMADLFGWIISFFLLIALLVLVTYQVGNFLSLFHRLFQSILLTLLIVFCLQLMCLADLEFDYINPYDFSSRINAVVFPEFVIQAVLTFFYLVTGHWIMSLFCLPYLYFNVGM
jgi:putative copper export protein